MFKAFTSMMLAAADGPSAIPYEVYKILSPALLVLMTLVSVGIIIVVLMQKSSNDNVSAITGGSSESFYGKNKTESKEGKLRKATVILAVALLVISVVYFVLAAL